MTSYKERVDALSERTAELLDLIPEDTEVDRLAAIRAELVQFQSWVEPVFVATRDLSVYPTAWCVCAHEEERHYIRRAGRDECSVPWCGCEGFVDRQEKK